jgi:ankyrin repeat protein
MKRGSCYDEDEVYNRSYKPTSPLDIKRKSAFTQLHVAISEGSYEAVSDLLDDSHKEEMELPDQNGNTPLIWAAIQNDIEIAEALIESNANVNAQNYEGQTSLFLAISLGYEEMARILLENGANPNISTLEGVTPLHMAAANGARNLLVLLLGYGAFVNEQDENGDTVMHYAVREGRVDIVKFLASFCDTKSVNEDDETPLDLATLLGEKAMMQVLACV